MNPLPFRMNDADNHLYEPDDCFTRHLESRFAERAMHVRRGAGGTGQWFFGDIDVKFCREAIDRTLRPGDVSRLRAGQPPNPAIAGEHDFVFVETTEPAFRDPEARLARMNEQGIEAAIVYHGAATFAEHEMRSDPEAAHANIRAYNRWIQDDWGFAYRERIFVPAVLSMLDPEQAVRDLEEVLRDGARLVMLRPGPIYGTSPADRRYDPFWARIDEARVPVIYHVAQSGYTHWYAKEWGEDPDINDQEMTPFHAFTCFAQRPVQDTILNIAQRNLFGRFPNLQVVSVENGSGWVKPLLAVDHHLQLSVRTRGGTFDRGGDFIQRPLLDTLRDHLWVSPYPEEDPREVIEILGEERVLFGSDYPHPEGLAEPRAYVRQLKGFSDASVRRIMRENTAGLLGLAA